MTIDELLEILSDRDKDAVRRHYDRHGNISLFYEHGRLSMCPWDQVDENDTSE